MSLGSTNFVEVALVSSGVIDLSPITECKVIHSLTIMEAKKSVFIFNIKD